MKVWRRCDFRSSGVAQDYFGVSKGLDIANRRLTEEALVFVAELTRTLVSDFKCRSRIIEAVREHTVTSGNYENAFKSSAVVLPTAAGITKEVVFAPVDDQAMNDRIDDAYRAKYAKSPYLNPMISARARAATIRIAPRDM